MDLLMSASAADLLMFKSKSLAKTAPKRDVGRALDSWSSAGGGNVRVTVPPTIQRHFEARMGKMGKAAAAYDQMRKGEDPTKLPYGTR